ncbi:RagB/SusD family nutrient uptake outer membrane protein [uncultured Bacteroides sp.]|uniref:RagB/SusD family nutrient uptake outer membrane protein n=1 Tax=uncultured Bacteroides sp. TaxID=162156 RepID=UPI002AAAAF18|nr:RagB/SusD family nutrient uptake outer membrane protein [uncultured Bacteroides sp.]
MKNIKYYISVLTLIFALSSCQDYLNVLPENEQNSSEYWKTKEEVQAVLASGYVNLRLAQEDLFLWGESRGNGVIFFGDGSTGQKAAQKVRSMDILLNNDLAKWDAIYKVINMANSVIKYAPGVVEKDKSFNVNVMNSYLSEAYFLRALSYFYLVRVFGNVPYVVEPYVDDNASYVLEATSGNDILEKCVTDLNGSLETAKEYFPETDAANPMNTKGRATKWAIYSLLADINLWLGNYQDCITECDAVINSKRVGLIQGASWFTNFYPGNSNESIFEIQYSKPLAQTNSFINWFSTNHYYLISPYELSLFNSDNDIRGGNASYMASDESTIWKYIGKLNDGATARDGSTENDQNYIIYRLADIYLMKSEANIMLGTDDGYAKGADLINQIRERAGLADISATSNQQSMLLLLLQERQREFFAEGKCWFDLLRIGSRDNYKYKELLIEQVLSVAGANNQAVMRSKLADTNSWYMPYHEDETAVNPLLKQNSYYEKLGK